MQIYNVDCFVQFNPTIITKTKILAGIKFINMFLKERTDIGALYETFIATEIIKRGHELRYWRTKAGAEVDFFLEKPEGLTAIECKTTIDSPKITRSLRSFIEKLD